MGRKVIVDVDTGIDDAMALMLILNRPDVEVLAITCVSGNTQVDNVCTNTLRVLKICGKEKVPVFRGSEKSLLDTHTDASFFHGEDGLGDVDWTKDDEVDTGQIQSEHAVMAILRLVNQFPGEVTLVPLGPMTNIALALKLDPNLSKKLKEVYIMGGNIEGHGNVTVSSEFNFYGDPEAARICLNGFKTPITLVPWEVCVDTQSRIPWSNYDEWVSLDTPKARFFHRITQHWIHNVKVREQPGFRSCDLFAMTTLLDSSSVLEKVDVYATVELHGELTRGQMVIDWKNRLEKDPNVTIIKRICVDKVKAFILEMLK